MFSDVEDVISRFDEKDYIRDYEEFKRLRVDASAVAISTFNTNAVENVSV